MGFYNYCSDLSKSTAYTTHTVGSYDINTTSGGGVFRWVRGNNVGITSVPGFRIKPLASTGGYWERIYDGAINVDWFGTMKISSQGTLASYGFTQPQLNTIYGTGLVLTTDTYDTAAVKTAFKLMETPGFQSVEFRSGFYYLTSSCVLPVPTLTGGQRVHYKINGNMCNIKLHSSVSTAFDVIYSMPPNLSVAISVYTFRTFKIENFLFEGDNSIGTGKAFINLNGSYNTKLADLNISNYDIGIKMTFTLNSTIDNVTVDSMNTYGLWLTYGSQYGGGVGSSQCNHSSISHFRNVSTSTQIAGIKCEAMSGLLATQNIYEGTAGQYGYYFDGIGSNTKECKFINNHIENSPSQAGFYFRVSNGIYEVDGVYSQYTGTFIECDTLNYLPDVGSSPTPGNPEVLVRKVANLQNAQRLKNTGSGCGWTFDHFIPPSGFTLTDNLSVRNATVGTDTLWVGVYKSTSTLTWGTGSRSLVVPTGKSAYYAAGQNVVVENIASPSQQLQGTITSYNNVTGDLVVNIGPGSGTNNNWIVYQPDNSPFRDHVKFIPTAFQ